MPTQDKIKAPKGWEITDQTEQGVHAQRTYPDGSSETILAHNEDELKTNAGLMDDSVNQRVRDQQTQLLEEARQHEAEAERLREQAKGLDWAR